MGASERGQPAASSCVASRTRIFNAGRPTPSPAGGGPTRRPRAGPPVSGPQTRQPSDLPCLGRSERTPRFTRLRPGSPFPRAEHQSTMDHGTQTTAADRPGWTTVTLVSDSFPCKRKPPLRVILLVGTTQQRVECRVNLQAGVRVSPSGTPPGPYSAYTCPSPGATDWS